MKSSNLINLIKNNWSYILFVLVLLFSLFYFFNYTYKNIEVQNNLESERKKESLLYRSPDSSDKYKIFSTSSRTTIINYISLDCIYCRGAFLAEDKLKDKYEGKLNIIYRHNPLDHQPLSPEKALISECVYEQGGNEIFFDFISLAFSNFDKINKDNNWLEKIAMNYIDSKEIFESCLKDISVKNKIQTQKNENILAGITYTPTLLVFIDGKFVKKFDNLGSAQVIKIMDFYTDLN